MPVLIGLFVSAMILAWPSHGMSPAEREQAKQIVQGGPSSLRNAAKAIYNRGGSQHLLDLLAERLLQNLGQNGKQYADALAWSCKALGQSGVKRYAQTLQLATSAKGSHKKVRKHCRKAWALLGEASGPQYQPGMIPLTVGTAAPAPQAAAQTSGVRQKVQFDNSQSAYP